MLRSTYIRTAPISLIAGIAINSAVDRVALSFQELPGVTTVVAKYSGNFEMLQKDGLVVHLPQDMPSTINKGYRLMTLINQLPELKTTKQVAIYSPGCFVGEFTFERFLEDKGIDVESITSLLMNRCFPGDESVEATKAFERKKLENSWLKRQGYR